MKAIYRTSLSTDPANADHNQHSGQMVKAEPLDISLYDKDETGPMFAIAASDGWTAHAFQDELTFIDEA